jgi:hypothetical protein
MSLIVVEADESEREADFDEPADLWGCKPASRDAFW